eukprot:2149762-Prymnesium_polylepis.1
MAIRWTHEHFVSLYAVRVVRISSPKRRRASVFQMLQEACFTAANAGESVANLNLPCMSAVNPLHMSAVSKLSDTTASGAQGNKPQVRFTATTSTRNQSPKMGTTDVCGPSSSHEHELEDEPHGQSARDTNADCTPETDQCNETSEPNAAGAPVAAGSFSAQWKMKLLSRLGKLNERFGHHSSNMSLIIKYTDRMGVARELDLRFSERKVNRWLKALNWLLRAIPRSASHAH